MAGYGTSDTYYETSKCKQEMTTISHCNNSNDMNHICNWLIFTTAIMICEMIGISSIYVAC